MAVSTRGFFDGCAMNSNDKQLHGAYGDSVVQPEENEAESDRPSHKKAGAPGMAQAPRPNVQIYLQEIRKPDVALKLRRQGCAGWPCHDGYLCNFCLLRTEWTAEAKIGPMEEEIDDLRHTVMRLRKQQANAETLKKAERLVTGKYWSAMEDNRLGTLNSLLEDSKARLEAQEAVRAKAAAETAQESLLEQLTTMQEKLDQKEKDLSAARQKSEALFESLADTQRQLRFVNGELDQKRMMIADAIKEKSRAGHEVSRLKSLLSAQDSELIVRGEQVAGLISEVQRLQGVEAEREALRALAEERAGLALGVMEEVAEDIVMAERTRDQHAQQIRRMTKEQQLTKKTMVQQNTTMARLRTELQEAKTSLTKIMTDDLNSPFATAPLRLPAAGRSSPMRGTHPSSHSTHMPSPPQAHFQHVVKKKKGGQVVDGD